MPDFEPRDAQFKVRIAKSFEIQPFAGFIGAELMHVAPGSVDIGLPFKRELTQQAGYVHGGVLTTIADAAAGYAAMTLAAREFGVLTTELKVNFLRPAGAGRLVAKGRVIKPGRSLTIVQADVWEAGNSDAFGGTGGGADIHVLTGLVSMMFVEGLA